MSMHNRLVKLETNTLLKNQLRYVIRLIGDESLEAAKAAKGWSHIPDDELFIIHLVFVSPEQTNDDL